MLSFDEVGFSKLSIYDGLVEEAVLFIITFCLLFQLKISNRLFQIFVLFCVLMVPGRFKMEPALKVCFL